MATPANPMISQKAQGRWAKGILTFIEKTETTSVGTMIEMVMMLSVFIRTLRLLLTIEARACVRLARLVD